MRNHHPTSRPNDQASGNFQKTKVRAAPKGVLELPHEKDESTDGTTPPTRPIIKRAASDLKRGLKDTDRGMEMHKTYKKL